ncbi:MAG: CbtB-domain containing protein [Alphaproteobacteria bacterium]|nr:CbtB-domain containing protein [Alphaproteobacteria bacterium]
MTSTSLTRPVPPTTLPEQRAAMVRAALLTGALGLLLVWGVGFAGPDALHAAAHDSRHALTFPCH